MVRGVFALGGAPAVFFPEGTMGMIHLQTPAGGAPPTSLVLQGAEGAVEPMLRLNLMQRAEANAKASSVEKNPEEPEAYKESAAWEQATDSNHAVLDGRLHQVSGWWELAIMGPSIQLTLFQNPVEMNNDQRVLRYTFQPGMGWSVGSAEVKGVQPVSIHSDSTVEQPSPEEIQQTTEQLEQ